MKEYLASVAGAMAAAGVVEQVDRIRGGRGRQLFLHRFVPSAPCASALLLHGIQSHTGWYRDTCRTLAGAGVEVASLERRGSGIDLRDRGDAASAAVLLRDALCAGEHVAATSGHRPSWIGVSWGGKLAFLAAQERPDALAGLALVVPGLFTRIALPRAHQLLVPLLVALGGRFRLPIPLEDPALFSDLPEFQDFVARDPLSLHQATARFMLASRRIDERIQRSTRRLDPRLPVLLFLAADDAIVDNRKTEQWLRWRAGEQLETVLLRGARHTPEFSRAAGEYQRRLVAFCRCAGTGHSP